MSELNNLFDIDPLLYISGVLFPISSIQITTSFNAYPRATIAVPPDARLYGIGRNDRIPIHVFIKDTFIGGREEETPYILVFEGEIESFSYVSSTMSRNIVINAVHTMAFLEDIHIKLLTVLSEHSEAHIPGAQFASATIASPPASHMPLSLFMKGIASVTEENIISYPNQFIENIVTYIEAEALNTDNPVHAYFSQLSKEWSTSKRIATVPYFDDDKADWNLTGAKSKAFPILAALQTNKAIQQLSGRAGSGPHQGNVFSFIDYIFSMMEYEFGVPNSPSINAGGTLNSLIAKPMFYDALPPACNIIFRSEIQEITTLEKVRGVPTRIKMEDISSAISHLVQGNESVLAKFAVMNFYPTHPDFNAVPVPGNKDPVAIEPLLDIEEHTGPKVYDTQSPPWLGFVNNKLFGEDDKAFIKQLMEHMYLLKRYEGRNISVTTPYNPYITVGYPGVVFDANDTNFTFVGQVLSVSHTISKTSMSTQVELGFVRMLSDEKVLIPNSVSKISDRVTHSKDSMSTIYNEILGCNQGAVSIEDLINLASKSSVQQFDYHNNPTEAYRFNHRSIITLEEYLTFIGSTMDPTTRDLSGPRFDASARFDKKLAETLTTVRDDVTSYNIYEHY